VSNVQLDDNIRIWLLKEEGFKSAPETWKCRRRNNFFGQLIPDPRSRNVECPTTYVHTSKVHLYQVKRSNCRLRHQISRILKDRKIFSLEISGSKVMLVLLCKFSLYRAVRALIGDPDPEASASPASWMIRPWRLHWWSG